MYLHVMYVLSFQGKGKPPLAVGMHVFFDILIISKGVSALALFLYIPKL